MFLYKILFSNFLFFHTAGVTKKIYFHNRIIYKKKLFNYKEKFNLFHTAGVTKKFFMFLYKILF